MLNPDGFRLRLQTLNPSMKRAIKISAVAATVGAVALGGALAAYANSGWAITSKAVRLKVRVDDMPRGVTPSVAKDGTKAVVSWSAQEVGLGAKMQRYVVTAHNVDDPPRADVSHTVVASGANTESIAFAAGEVADGRWYWTLVPKYESWVGAESKKSDKLNFPAAPQASRPAETSPAEVTTGATPTTTATDTEAAPEQTTSPTEPSTSPTSSSPSASETLPVSAPGGPAPQESAASTGPSAPTEDTHKK